MFYGITSFYPDQTEALRVKWHILYTNSILVNPFYFTVNKCLDKSIVKNISYINVMSPVLCEEMDNI